MARWRDVQSTRLFDVVIAPGPSPLERLAAWLFLVRYDRRVQARIWLPTDRRYP